MAAGLTDQVWSLQEVLLCGVPPWPQAQRVYNTAWVDDWGGERRKCAWRQSKREARVLTNTFGVLMTRKSNFGLDRH